MTADEEIAGLKDCLMRLFKVPVGSRWENVFFPQMIVEVVDVTDVGNGQNVGVHQPASVWMESNYWHMNIVDFLAAYRPV